MGSQKNRKPKFRKNYCEHCGKSTWSTRERADAVIERMKMTYESRKPYLLDSYRCTSGRGWHIGTTISWSHSHYALVNTSNASLLLQD